MRPSSLVLFAVVLIIAIYTLPISGKSVKQTTTTPAPKSATTVKPSDKKPEAKPSDKAAAAKPTEKTAAAKPTEKTPAAKPSSKVGKKKKSKKGKKPKKAPWKVPDAEQKKLFNDYKNILRSKLNARKQNISATFQLEPLKYGSQTADDSILHHFLIKLPDSKFAHAIIGTKKDAKKPSPVNENSASIRRTIYDNLEAAGA